MIRKVSEISIDPDLKDARKGAMCLSKGRGGRAEELESVKEGR